MVSIERAPLKITALFLVLERKGRWKLKKYQIYILGIITPIAVLWPFVSPSVYVPMVLLLDWRAYFVFGVLYAVVSWILVYLFKDSGMTLETFFKEKIKKKRLKYFLLNLFRKKPDLLLLLFLLF